ncbi:MAG: serine hydrolase domain-containing protein [Marinicella sp.]
MRNMLFIIGMLISSAVQAFEWPVAEPEDINLNAAHINAAISQIESGSVGNIRSLLIIKEGQLVTEKYFANSGEKRPVYSVTKSVGATLLGIAKYQGADINLETSIMTYLPQYENIPNIQQANLITLHDLLTQRHGYNWDEWSTDFGTPFNPITQILNTADWYRSTLQWPIAQLPDQNFTYSTGHSSIMSPILENRTGQDVYDFAINELFQPLDITDTHWELISGGGIQGQGISTFPHGTEPLGFGLWLKPYDMAKIGELYRLNGIWQGERLLSEEWINLSIEKYSDDTTDADVFTTPHSGYGYQWWVVRLTDTNQRPVDIYYANGYGRQYIMVFPEYQTVIVSTAEDFFYEGPGIGTVLTENLLLAFETGKQGIEITSDFNGSWYWPENSGQGINFEILDDGSKIAGFWYTYEQSGGQQRWFSFQGDVVDDSATFNIYATSGGGFVESGTPELTLWGQGSITIYD